MFIVPDPWAVNRVAVGPPEGIMMIEPVLKVIRLLPVGVTTGLAVSIAIQTVVAVVVEDRAASALRQIVGPAGQTRNASRVTIGVGATVAAARPIRVERARNVSARK